MGVEAQRCEGPLHPSLLAAFEICLLEMIVEARKCMATIVLAAFGSRYSVSAFWFAYNYSR